jgi:hypothetical protein
MNIDRNMGMGNCLFSHTRISLAGRENPWAVYPLIRSWKKKVTMVNQCANPSCDKEFHYLREGRIFVFDLPDPDVPVPAPGGRARRLQHFWLCGPCSETMALEQTSETQIRVAVKSRKVEAGSPALLPGSLAL